MVNMDAETHTEDIVFNVSQFPPGSIITVKCPACPECHKTRETLVDWKNGSGTITGHESTCDCGFDWDEWVMNTYS